MFTDRQHAGRLLAHKIDGELSKLSGSRELAGSLVVGVGHGGMPVAEQVALRLHAPLSGFAAELIPPRTTDEADIGAVCSCGLVIFGDGASQHTGNQHGYVGQQIKELTEKARLSEQRWRNLSGIGCPTIRNRRVVIVEEAITSGITSRAAVASLRQSGAEEIILATPVIWKATEEQLARECDLLVSIITTDEPFLPRDYYHEHHDVNEQEVIEALKEAAMCCQRASHLIAGSDMYQRAN